jgi:hypothetical protein
VGTAWDAVEGVGVARGAAEVDEVCDEEVVKGRAVGPPATGPWAV